MPVDFREKRAYPRIDLKAPIRYQIRGIPSYQRALSNDISVGGMGFTCDDFIPIETSLMLEINLLRRILKPIGKIVRSCNLPHTNKNRLGIEFVEIDPQEKMFLNDYINMRRTERIG